MDHSTLGAYLTVSIIAVGALTTVLNFLNKYGGEQESTSLVIKNPTIQQEYTYLNLSTDCQELLGLEETTEQNPFWKDDLSFRENGEFMEILEFKGLITVSSLDGPFISSTSFCGSEINMKKRRANLFQHICETAPELSNLTEKIEQIGWDTLVPSKKHYRMVVTTNLKAPDDRLTNNWEMYALEFIPGQNGYQLGYSIYRIKFSTRHLELIKSSSREKLTELTG